MRKALRRAAWGLTAGLVTAGPALAQYGAHLAGQDTPVKPSTPTIVKLKAATGTVIQLPSVTTLGGADTVPPVGPKTEGIHFISHTAATMSVVGQPTGYVLQAVNGQPVTTSVLDSHTKLEEMKVELALLADPATFACNLSAKLEGNAMLVRGFVPNDAVREHAMEIARAGTHLPIADGLKIHHSLAMRSAGVPIAAVQQGAQDLVAEGFPEIAGGIEVRATITGQITLTGSARSYEEKLGVSQRLRRLNGCTAVINQLKVTPLVRAGQSLTMVTADGLHVVPSEVAELPPGRMVQAIPAIRIGAPTHGSAKLTAVEQLSAPVTPNVMRAPPISRVLPSALPVPADVTQGTVTFEDVPDTKPRWRK